MRELTVEGAGLRCCDELKESVQAAPVLLQSELRGLSALHLSFLPLGLPRTTNSKRRPLLSPLHLEPPRECVRLPVIISSR
jgi:hypothetical protein